MKHQRLVLPAILLMTLPAAIRAETTVSVGVQIRLPIPIQRYGPDKVHGVESDTADKIARALGATYRHWLFGGTVGGQEGVLTLVVDEPQRNDVWVHLKTAPNTGQTWEVPWLKPGDLEARRFPELDQLATELLKVFKEGILEKQEASIGTWLRTNVPVATSGAWHSSPAASLNVVLPLEFTRHRKLAESAILAIEGRKPGERLQTLSLEGLPQASPYPPDSAAPSFEAIQGQAYERQIGRSGPPQPIDAGMAGELRALTLGSVYLKEEGRPAFDDAFDPRDLQ